MKKLVSLFTVLLVSLALLVPEKTALAYADGLLQGQPISLGQQYFKETTTTLKLTDNDESTSYPLDPSTAGWYSFQSPSTIDSIKIKSNAPLIITFFNEKKTSNYYI